MHRSNSKTVGAVVLCAGQSQRFGAANKLLATIDGPTIIERVVRTVVASTVTEGVVVVGHQAEALRDRIAEYDVQTVRNPEYATGQSTSVRCGIEYAATEGWDAAVILLGDMPFVAEDTIDRLVAEYRAGAGGIIAPEFDGTRGNPVLFGRPHFERLRTVSGDKGGREILDTHSDVVLVTVDDSGVVRDIDTIGDIPAHHSPSAND